MVVGAHLWRTHKVHAGTTSVVARWRTATCGGRRQRRDKNAGGAASVHGADVYSSSLGTEWRAEWSCLRTMKHVDALLLDVVAHRHVWVKKTAADSVTKSGPNRSGACGSWWSRRLVADQRISVFAAFSWRRFERIHSATWSIHVEIRDCNSDWDNTYW